MHPRNGRKTFFSYVFAKINYWKCYLTKMKTKMVNVQLVYKQLTNIYRLHSIIKVVNGALK